MKACPLSAALSAPPSLYGADYPHPESPSFTFSFSLSLSVHPISTPPTPTSLLSVLLHLHTENVASILMNETAACGIKRAHPFSIFTLFILSSLPLTVSDPLPLSCRPSFNLAPSQRNKPSGRWGSAREGDFHVPQLSGLC